jgi:TRAP-type C4-dicarboxylate transport system permease small subunit
VSVLKYLVSFRWANRLSEAAGWLCAVALVAATLVMLHSVLTRYVFQKPTVWQTEVSIYLLIFVTFVGAAFGLKHHAHVGVDLLVERLPVRAQLAVRIVTAVLALVVVGFVGWTAAATWYEAYEGGFVSPTALRFPLAIAYAILPLGMILVGLQYIAMIIEAVAGLLGKHPESAVALLGQGNAELAAVRAELERTPAALADETATGDLHDATTRTKAEGTR